MLSFASAQAEDIEWLRPRAGRSHGSNAAAKAFAADVINAHCCLRQTYLDSAGVGGLLC